MLVKSTNLTVYARGTVWMAKNYNKEAEGLQSGNRPFLIISNNDRGSSKVVEGLWISSQEKPPIKVNVKFTNHVGQINTVLCNQHDTVKVDDLIKYMGSLSDSKMREVELAMMYAQGLERYADLGSRLDKLEILLGAIKDERLEAHLDGIRDEGAILTKRIEDLESRMNTACKVHEKDMESKKETAEILDKSQKKPKGFWTNGRMSEFLKDYKDLGVKGVASKWNLSEKSIGTMVYNFRKKFKEISTEDITNTSDNIPAPVSVEQSKEVKELSSTDAMRQFVKDKEILTLEAMQQRYNMAPKTICSLYYEFKAKLEG